MEISWATRIGQSTARSSISLCASAGCLLMTDTSVSYAPTNEDTVSSDVGGTTETGGDEDTGGSDGGGLEDTEPEGRECDEFCDNVALLNECAERPRRPCPRATCEVVSEDCFGCIVEADCGDGSFCEDACGLYYCVNLFPEECGEFDAGFPDAFDDAGMPDPNEPYPGACEDLSQCCAEFTPAPASMECAFLLLEAGNNDRACAEALWVFEQAGNCDINEGW